MAGQSASGVQQHYRLESLPWLSCWNSFMCARNYQLFAYHMVIEVPPTPAAC